MALLALAAVSAFLLTTVASPDPPLLLAPHSLRVEYLRAPLGVETARAPRFSWRLAAPGLARNLTQAAYELQICRTATFGGGPAACHGSGRQVVSSLSVNVLPAPALALEEDEAYTWRVRWWAVEGGQPSPFSLNATFGTELRKGWAGSTFIGGNYTTNQLRTEFILSSHSAAVGRAVLYIVGLGNYRVELSGTPVSSHFLAPFRRTVGLTPLRRGNRSAPSSAHRQLSSLRGCSTTATT